MALVTALITALVLVTLATASMIYSRSDVMVSDNSKHGSAALWLAQLGNERAKNYLRTDNGWKNVPGSTSPLYAAGTTYSGIPNATYGTSVSFLGNLGGGKKFLIRTDATAPDGSSVAVEESVALAGANIDLQAINVQGTGTHTKLDDSNPTRVPSWFIDARDHDRNGNVCGAGNTVCPTAFLASALAGTPGTASNDARVEMDNMREDLANEAVDCQTDGSDCDTPFMSGLYWMKKAGFSDASCARGAPFPCDKSLNLGDPHLFAYTHTLNLAPAYPDSTDTPWAEMFHGPIVSADNDADPDYHDALRILTSSQDTLLQNLVIELLQFALNTDNSRRRAITTDITTSHAAGAYGTWSDPTVTIICDPGHPVLEMAKLSSEFPCNGIAAPNNTQVRNGAVFTGTGLLIVPRSLEIDDATFHWRGIVLVLNQGRFQVKKIGGSADACGMVLGAVLLQDETGNDMKVDFIQGSPTECDNQFAALPTRSPPLTGSPLHLHGFGVKYSKEAVENALTSSLITIAWREVYQGEQ